MSADIFMAMLNGILVLGAIAAKILTSNLIIRQKRVTAELTAARQGKVQRMQAVHKRLTSLQSTHEMMVRKRNSLQDDIDNLKSELSELERQEQGASSIPEETAADQVQESDDEETDQDQESDGEADQDQESDGEETDQDQESDDEPESRQIRSRVGRGSSLFEDENADSKKPRKIRTYIDKIKSGRGKSQDSTDSDD